MSRTLIALASLSLLATACGGDGGGGGCTIEYTGGVAETVGCDSTVRRADDTETSNYSLWIIPFKGGNQAGQLTLVLDGRPEAGVDYAIVDGVAGTGVVSGFFERRTAGGEVTHEVWSGGAGSLTVRFTSLPAQDGPGATGLDGVGTVHGTFTATLVPAASGTDVTAAGTF